MSVRPESAEEVAEAVRAHSRVAARGGGTKAALIGEGEVIEMSGVAGITEYEPSEYTFTAKAGTAVREVEEALEAKGQYLPFDPLFVDAGATLGGTAAAGTSGPRRFRYGGLRDFLIGVQFVDGCGKLVRSGGKVVKNAAGFDLPKFLVGSCGRFGIMTELSFKVFPAPFETVTLGVRCADHATAVERLGQIASSRWEAEALDYEPGERTLWMRMGGPGEALDLLGAEIANRWPGEVERLDAERAARLWQRVREMHWAPDCAALVKVPLTPSKLGAMQEPIDDTQEAQGWYSSGAAVGWLAVPGDRIDQLDGVLRDRGLRGLVLRGARNGPPWLGVRDGTAIYGAVKKALDPEGRFPPI